MSRQVTPAQFIAKWSKVTLSERAASQEHFIDLCRLLGQPTPAEYDATGDEYTFEKGVAVTGTASRGSRGERGFADVWWKGKFAWEYKRKGKYRDLTEAYHQLCQYRDALEFPPLLIVSDIARTEIRTNFTGTARQLHTIELADLDKPESLDLLRRVFTDPDSFKPTVTTEAVTREVARQFAELARALRSRGHEPHEAAHFLMKCMFCLFAEDVGLLPSHLFERLLRDFRSDPKELTPALTDLFAKMQTGGRFGAERIDYFNGGLFDDSPALRLTAHDIDVLLTAAGQDWGSVEPAIFGTLFERSLDPNTRAQIGAHYTSREDIMLVVEPVVMAPLRRQWEEKQAEVDEQLERRRKAKTKATKARADEAIQNILRGFVFRLSAQRVLDPACGSGNFLYVAIQQLLDLEKQVITYAARPEIGVGLFPQVRPTQLHGIEINAYAAELAQVVIWIGYLQWMRDNGYIQGVRKPILEPLQSIECRDAILAWQDKAGQPLDTWREGAVCIGPAEWPEAEFIIGNPPFLGSKVFRQQGLEDDYIKAMYSAFDLPNTSDLCCYWFELARRVIEHESQVRAGLLATQGIRGGSNRTVLERIKETGDIFMAWSDRRWILDGAAVHVSIVGFDPGVEESRALDGKVVARINANLSRATDTTRAALLAQNESVAFQGPVKVGDFDIDAKLAREMLADPNPRADSNRRVLMPWVNGADISRRGRGMWIIDFGPSSLREAAMFCAPFRHVEERVKPSRIVNKDRQRREYWWRLGRSGGDWRLASHGLRRVLVTPRVAKHRLFTWSLATTLPDSAVVGIARSDDYFFGVLHSSIHELWARRMGTQLREAESGFRYTPTTCFETFPLPWPPGEEPDSHPGAGVPRHSVAQPPPAGEMPGGIGDTASGGPHPRAGVLHVAQPPSAGKEAKEAKSHYRRNLPHIQPGFRPVFVTFCTRDRWVLPERVRSMVVEHCLHDHGTKLHMHGLVVMPDHVHLVFTPLVDSAGTPYALAELMSGIKGASAHRINKALNRLGSVWQDESFDHILRRNEKAEEKVDYICHNPVRQGLVESEEDYRWLWREWVDDVAQPPSAGEMPSAGGDGLSATHPGAGVPHVAQPPSAGEIRDDASPGTHPGAGVPHALCQDIAEAAKELNEQRERWLNPPEWIEPIARAVDAADDFSDVPAEARELIRQSAIMARAAKDRNLKRRTLTNLYNERPTWLKLAHERLDRAVLSAYAHVDPEGNWSPDWAEVWTETGAGQSVPDDHELAERRREVDQLVLANLLRMNLARAACE